MQQDDYYGCVVNGPSLLQRFGYGLVAGLAGHVVAAVSNDQLIVSVSPRGAKSLTLRFTDGGAASTQPPIVAAQSSGARPVRPPPSVTGSTASAPTAVASPPVDSGAHWVGVHWRLTRIDEAGVTTAVPAAADEWLELNKDLSALTKFSSCEPAGARWMPTNSGMLTEVYPESEWPCPSNGVPTVAAFATTDDSHIVALGVEDAGATLIVTFDQERLHFVDAGRAIEKDVPQDQSGPAWVPVPQDALEGVEAGLTNVRWVLRMIKSGSTTTMFDLDDSVDMHLYGDASLGLSELCTSRGNSWRPATEGFRILPWHRDFLTCATKPPPAVVDLGWPSVTALIGAGPLIAAVTGNSLTIVHDDETLTFDAVNN